MRASIYLVSALLVLGAAGCAKKDHSADAPASSAPTYSTPSTPPESAPNPDQAPATPPDTSSTTPPPADTTTPPDTTPKP